MSDDAGVERTAPDGSLVHSIRGAVGDLLSSVDVHDLASMPIAVQGRVLTEGVLILSTDEIRRVRFEERTRRRYFDFLPFQERDTEEGLEGLREHDVLSRDLAARLSSLARFRNLLVYVYADVDDSRVHRFLQADLGDFDDFATAVLDLLEADA